MYTPNFCGLARSRQLSFFRMNMSREGRTCCLSLSNAFSKKSRFVHLWLAHVFTIGPIFQPGWRCHLPSLSRMPVALPKPACGSNEKEALSKTPISCNSKNIKRVFCLRRQTIQVQNGIWRLLQPSHFWWLQIPDKKGKDQYTISIQKGNTLTHSKSFYGHFENLPSDNNQSQFWSN